MKGQKSDRPFGTVRGQTFDVNNFFLTAQRSDNEMI